MTKADTYLYHDIHNILDHGYKDVDPRPKYADGTPAHTISVNQVFRKYDISRGEFPLLTLRPIAIKTGIREIFAIYQKGTHILADMRDMGIGWWDDWDIGDGSIGHRYGYTVSQYDLMNNLLNDIKNDPYGRRKVMSLWQEEHLRETPGLAPCAFLTMWNVRDKYLDMTLVQRSGDMLTASGAGGINEVQYACLLLMTARHTGYQPGVFAHLVQNEQIYDRHYEQAEELLRRYEAKKQQEEDEKSDSQSGTAPEIILKDGAKDFFDMTVEDFEIRNYEPIRPQLKFELGI